MMEQIKLKLRELDITDWCLIIFFASRMYTSLFTLLLGPKGVLVSMGCLALLYLSAIIYNIKQGKYKFSVFFILIFVILSMTFATMYFNPETKFWINDFSWGFVVKVLDPRKAIFAVLVLLLVDDIDDIERDLTYSARVFGIYLILQCFLFLINGNWDNYFHTLSNSGVDCLYNMNLGYELIFVAIVLIINSWYTKNKYDFVFGLFCSSSAFLYGSRGLLVNAIVFALFFFFFLTTGKEEKIKAAKFLVILIVASVILMFIQNKVICEITYRNLNEEQIQELMNQDGDSSELVLGSRTANMASSGNLWSSNGRFDIYKIGINAIKDGHVFGEGVYGDRPHVGQEYEWGYSHNIFIEMIVSFGIFGVIFICYMAYKAFQVLLDRETGYQKLMFIFLVLSTKLLISDSFWFLSYFWAFLTIIYLYDTDDLVFNVKSSLKIIGVAFVSAVICMCVFLQNDVEHQDFKVLKFDKPTVAVVVENPLDYVQYIKAEQLMDHDKYFTVCPKISRIMSDDPQCNTILNKYLSYGAGFQDGGYDNKALSRCRHDSIQHRMFMTNAVFSDYDLAAPVAVLPTYGITNRTISYNLMQKRDFIITTDSPSMNTVYKTLNKAQAQNIYALELPSKPTKEDLDSALRDIDLAVKSNSFITIVIGNSTDDVNCEYTKILLNKLIADDFDFVGFDELYEKSRCTDKDMTLSNYLRNSFLSHYLR